ncbi:MAG: DNA alkylation repair protein [Clostridia bacterium]|nr:DNA alkylation repair protein [Clostridia bacterium]
MEYSKLIDELFSYREEEFAAFQARIINSPKQKIIGVRTPVLRKLVKKYKGDYAALSAFPDEYYEVTFIKLNVAALLPYEKFVLCVEDCVNSIDNWATCDTFKARCIATHREEFLPYIRKFLTGGEFFTRYALVTLLSFYVEEKYLPEIFTALKGADLQPYYAHMGAAWLLAEVLVKEYDAGVEFLKQGAMPARTHNKAIQKAKESFRLTKEQKDKLNGLKRKEEKKIWT